MYAGGNYKLHWHSDENYIYIGIKGKSIGWVAIGFEPSDEMKDADIVFGLIKNGGTLVLDQFSTGVFGPHHPDIELGGTYDILEFGGKEENGTTIFEFKRALDTGDQYDKVINKGIVKIIWAYGLSDEINIKHAVRGDGEISI
ncbi:MAG: DOMON domain-containing protein [Dehalococcoidales bacterium]|nr:DOMON domain-containing protein [Dehalococcoidales bacterium]